MIERVKVASCASLPASRTFPLSEGSYSCILSFCSFFSEDLARDAVPGLDSRQFQAETKLPNKPDVLRGVRQPKRHNCPKLLGKTHRLHGPPLKAAKLLQSLACCHFPHEDQACGIRDASHGALNARDVCPMQPSLRRKGVMCAHVALKAASFCPLAAS